MFVSIVIVVVWAYSPVKGNRVRLRGRTPRDDVGPSYPVVTHSGPPSFCNRLGGR